MPDSLLGNETLLSQRGIVGGLLFAIVLATLVGSHTTVRAVLGKDGWAWFAAAAVIIGIAVGHLGYEALHRLLGVTGKRATLNAFRQSLKTNWSSPVAPDEDRIAQVSYATLGELRREIYRTESRPEYRDRLEEILKQRMTTSYIQSSAVLCLAVSAIAWIGFRPDIPSAVSLAFGILATVLVVAGYVANHVRALTYGRVLGEGVGRSDDLATRFR